ncbi:MAG: hypothetical protein HGGPFJEG_00642 [Ignavibacteria bacterium]|nr:hypothetical protein [Ignavibacteria bacterium]
MNISKFTVSLFIVSALLVSDYAFTYPRFAAYTGDKCIDCHVNPTGGLMRNKGGYYYAKNNLSMELFEKIAGKTQFSPKISKGITIGSDVRIAQVDNEVEGSTNFNSFLAMQGDLYVNAEINKILNVFATSGIQIPNTETEYEVYGMISNLPADLYFKVGRFKPNFGTRIVEHRAYQRKYLLNTPYDANTGFEIGVSPDWFNFNMGIYNPQNLGFLGIDPHKMFIASADFNFGFSDNDFNVNVGGSFFNNPYNTVDTSFTSTITANKKAYGIFTRLGIMKRVALLGEIDFEESKSDIPLRRALYGYGELNVIIIKGFEFRGQYEIYNKNRDVSGDDIQRISTGVAFFPFYGFETEAMVRFVIEEPSISNNEFQWNFHFYF